MKAPALPARFDPRSLAALDDPYPTYAQLRAAGPLCRAGAGQWLAGRYDIVAPLLRDPRLGQFQFRDAYQLLSGGGEPRGDQQGAAVEFTGNIVASQDGDRHRRLRQLLGRALTPGLQGLEPVIDRVVTEVLEPVLASRRAELVDEVAWRVPMRVLSQVLGIPDELQTAAAAHAVALTRVYDATANDTVRAAADAAVAWLRGVFGSQLEQRRGARSPTDDLLTRLVEAGQASGLGPGELVDNAVFVFFAGFETSVNLIANGCHALLRWPDQYRRLRQDRSLVEPAVEEFLRYDAPVQVTGRVVREPVTIDGRTIKPGRVLYLAIGAANRDERRFPAPDRLDLARAPNPHLSLGNGSHRCLGATLARLEARALFGSLAEHVAGWEPAGPPTRLRSPTLGGFTSLPVAIVPA